ncbi:MAG: hypothetical protein E7573_07385 [Ruminococcaceae bacterium]|nr:hypothetical protein [Oscillospiraceae bacterium]
MSDISGYSSEVKTASFRGLSGSVLKMIAMAAMLTDHISVVFFGPDMTVLRLIGRMAFPIFAYLIGEGVRYSKDIKKYALRLFIFALISEIPYDMAFSGSFFSFEKQNVYFTLLAGLISVVILRKLKEHKLGFLGIFTTALVAVVPLVIASDYGFMGVVIITLFYVFGGSAGFIRAGGFLLCCAASCFAIVLISPDMIGLDMIPFSIPIPGIVSSQIYSILAVIPLMLYNGEKGFKMNRYFFYAFYPVHILILGIIGMFIL